MTTPLPGEFGHGLDESAPVSEAVQVLRTFLDAGLRGDHAAMRGCLTKKTPASGKIDESGPQGVRYVLGEPTSEGEAVIVPVAAYPLDAPADATTPAAMEMNCVMVKEEGAWKFDLLTTMDRMFSGKLDGALEQTAAAMGTAMEGITEALGETMRQAFGESEPEKSRVNYLEAKTDYADGEFLPLLEMTPLPKVSAAFSAVCGAPVAASAAIGDLLKQVGSDDSATLINWFDNQLFETWGPLLSLLNARMPLAKRLKGFRVEPAKGTEDRMLILDGNDLVYRMYLNTTEGYYSDQYVDELLPGILAGLPPLVDEKAPAAGHRLIHLEGEEASGELYKDRVAPRFMRLICELLGKNLALDANWDDLYNPHQDVRQLYRWGMNRIYGAIALACHDPARQKQLAENLKTIRVILASTMSDRFAQYDGETLEVSLYYYPGEQGCFYEKDLERVLAGEAIRYVEPEGSQEEPVQEEENGKDEKEPSQDEAIRAKEVNDENFRTAAASLKENEGMWAMQVQMAVGHPVTLELDFDSLEGRYERVQPLIHQGMSAVVEAFPRMMVEGHVWHDFFTGIQQVSIAGAGAEEAFEATLRDGLLRVRVPLQIKDIPAPAQQVIEAFRALAGLKPAAAEDAPETPPAKKVMRYEDLVPPPFTGDPYAYAAKFVVDLEAAMKGCELWPGPPPKPVEEIEVRGAFGSENMSFGQWLAWVLIPRVKNLVETHGDFPSGSNVAAYAVRELDGCDTGNLIEVLAAFDSMVESIGEKNR